MMSLSLGLRLGPYEIVSLLGAGGMGEVYRARDTKLNREVAIKVLPELLANDPERLARFSREAQVLAALNHPNIAHIHGFEDSTGVPALVMELVEGPTLADRIARGPISIDEALPIAKQTAEALEAAHEQGIIHRDLKPANIKVRTDGTVKVLDFGLAKALDMMTASNPSVTQSPTITSPAMMTGVGIILGTAAYMSPEQARGRAVDRRADIWAFGCVLYEMLTGERAFDGEDIAETIGAVIHKEPDWNRLPQQTPERVRTVLKRCMEKHPKERIRDTGDLQLVLNGAFDSAGTRSEPLAPITIARRSSSRTWQVVAAILLLVTITAVAGWNANRQVVPTVTKFVIGPPDRNTFDINNRAAASGAISPDGTKIVFVARDSNGTTLLWIRPINSFVAQVLPGTSNGAYPFWSPDSRFIGYSGRGKLMKVSASGGPPQALCDFSGPGIVGRGGSWSRDNMIVFNNGPNRPLYRVSSSGGQAVPAWKLPEERDTQDFPFFLPDGKHVLFRRSTLSSSSSQGIFVGAIDGGTFTSIASADTGAVYAPNGYLLFVRQGTLVAQRFDAASLATSGEPVPVAEHVESGAIPGMVSFSVSQTGALAYGTGLSGSAELQMSVVDRHGEVIQSVGPPANYQGVSLSPDGTRFAGHRHEGDGGDIWVTDLGRGTTSRLTFNATLDNSSPVWSPDGTAIAYGLNGPAKFGLYRKLADGTGVEETLHETTIPAWPESWTRDGRTIIFMTSDPKTRQDLWTLTLSGDRKPTPWLATPLNEADGIVSPDGRWIAYSSNDTGRPEINVRPFPSGAGRWQISTDGGTHPRWRADGRELFFWTRGGTKLDAIEVKPAGTSIDVGGTTEILVQNLPIGNAGAPGVHLYANYAVFPDGQRILVARPIVRDAENGASICVVLNWQEELKAHVPTK